MKIPLLTSLLETIHKTRRQKERLALADLKARYHAFRIFLENNGVALELLAQLDSQLLRGDSDEIQRRVEQLLSVTTELVDGLNILSRGGHGSLYSFHGRLADQVQASLGKIQDHPTGDFCIPLSELPRNGEHLAGRKAANIARLKRLSLPVPDGFVCTVAGTKRFLKMGKLSADIQRLIRNVSHGQIDLNRAAERIRNKILDAPLPTDLAHSLEKQYRHLAQKEQGQSIKDQITHPISVRSSGVAEDGINHSFAGQFSSVLNVIGVPALFLAFKEVIASGFSARAISYRLNSGLSALDFELAVLCQSMAVADCAGVLFTVDPSDPESDRMLISAVPGLGTLAVGGATPADLYHPPRKAILETVKDIDAACPLHPATEGQAEMLMADAQISPRTLREVPAEGGGLRQENIDQQQPQPLLEPWVIGRLMYFGLLLENLWGMAQDIEWCFSASQGISLLQARPLRMASRSGQKGALETAARLLRGSCASSGKVIGCVRKAHSLKDLQELSRKGNQFEELPTILVLPQSIVDASNLLPHCRGAIVDIGNPTDHLSCIARELGMPMLTGTQDASKILENGQWIILDADHGAIFEASEVVVATAKKAFKEQKQQHEDMGLGRLDPLTRMRAGTIAPEREELRKLLVPLNLTDAYGATFSLLECRSIHDIIRYTHEMAVLAMFDTGDTIMDYAGGLLRPLDIGVPFSFLLIDLGGGIRRSPESFLRKRLAFHKVLTTEEVLCIPLKALCEGLTTPGLSYHSAPTGNALPGILSRTMLDKRSKRPAGSFNYALVARDYLNLNAKVEFHFAMLDAICGRNNRANYIRFRFKGGGAGLERGHRRVLFLQNVLERQGFFTTVVGDLITASLTGASRDKVYEQLVMLGRLIGFSRFLDGVMDDDETPRKLADSFLAGDYSTRLPDEEQL